MHSLAEASLLAVAGTAAALPLAVGTMSLIRAAAPADIWQLRTVALDGRVLAFCALSCSRDVSRLRPRSGAVECPGLAGRGCPREPKFCRSLRGRRNAAGLLVVSEVALALPLLDGCRSDDPIVVAHSARRSRTHPGASRGRPDLASALQVSGRAAAQSLLPGTARGMRGQPSVESAGITSLFRSARLAPSMGASAFRDAPTRLERSSRRWKRSSMAGISEPWESRCFEAAPSASWTTAGRRLWHWSPSRAADASFLPETPWAGPSRSGVPFRSTGGCR